MKKFIILIMAFVPFISFAQNVGIGITTPHPSAILDITSNNKGLLIPRMNQAQRDAIFTPATGLMIFQTDVTPGYYFYNGSSWDPISGGTATNYWSTTDGANIYNNNPGRVTIGGAFSGVGLLTIKSPVTPPGGYLFMSETGTTASDYLFASIYSGGGTTSTRYGAIIANFGNGFEIRNQRSFLALSSIAGEKLRITPAGLVGINTVTPTNQLEVQTPSSTYGITHTDGTTRLSTTVSNMGGSIGTTTNHHLRFFVNGSDQMTISTAGNVGIGGQRLWRSPLI